jgi:hypothetical protein
MFIFVLLNDDAIKGCVHLLDVEARVLPHFEKSLGYAVTSRTTNKRRCSSDVP